MSLFERFNPKTLRYQLNLAETRIDMHRNRKINAAAKAKDEIANLLRENNDELARIQAESLVREDFNLEVLQTLQLFVRFVSDRLEYLQVSATIPYDMKEACATLVYAADRVSTIPELAVIKRQLNLKYKKELASWLDTDERVQANVNKRVYERLIPSPPNANIVYNYMVSIAAEKGFKWGDDQDFANTRFDQPAKAPVGSSVVPGAASGIRSPYYVSDGTLSAVPKPGTIGTVIEPLFGSSTSTSPQSTVIPSLFASSPASASSTQESASGYIPSSTSISVAMASSQDGESLSDLPQAHIVSEHNQPLSSLLPQTSPATDSSEAPDFEELSRRFNALKNN